MLLRLRLGRRTTAAALRSIHRRRAPRAVLRARSPSACGGLRAGRGAFAQRVRERERPARSARDRHAARYIARNERGDVRPTSAAVRRCAYKGRYSDSSRRTRRAYRPAGATRSPARSRTVMRSSARPPRVSTTCAPKRTRDLEPCGGFEQLPAPRAARIDDRLDRDAGGRKVKRRLPAVIARREQRGAPPRRDAEAVHVGAHGRGHHDAGPVVAAKNDRPLDCAGGEHRCAWRRSSTALARLMRRRNRQMVRDALERAEGACP